MRAVVARIVLAMGVIGAIVAAGLWGYFAWTQPWGRFGSRAWGLWFMASTGGVLLMFFILILVASWVAEFIDPDKFR